MKVPDALYRMTAMAMMLIDIAAPIVLMAVVGKLLGQMQIALGVGFALGLLSYFKHWSRGNTSAADFKRFFTKQKPDESKGDGE